jgi:hypothetical protein
MRCAGVSGTSKPGLEHLVTRFAGLPARWLNRPDSIVAGHGCGADNSRRTALRTAMRAARPCSPSPLEGPTVPTRPPLSPTALTGHSPSPNYVDAEPWAAPGTTTTGHGACSAHARATDPTRSSSVRPP